ncbi:LysR family transcriptional regulator [Photobacterium aquae]|uniref:LysR family transcriptional regulator n=1 Tax=Photobacterium aquae TaxID=1195763 RepID=A0A0J1GVK3_9GAMM|nr:LysR substrate-binding domain-containing protein [Photobacterium aquae]KLV03715.1 LysR family transcriptional regulator [Photobacterium aquae]
MRKLVPLKSIYAFVAVAEMGSMTEAAAVLSVSHSAISQSIKMLETQLGVVLFRRVGRRVELNNDGRRYYRKVAPALTQIVEASESLARRRHGNRLTLNMVNTLALHWWIPRVSDFQQYAPDIDVRISNIIHTFDLELEGVDVALLHGDVNDWQDYYCEKLGDDQLIMVCSPYLLEEAAQRNPLSNGSPPSPDTLLARYPAIFATNPRRQNDWQIWCEAYLLPVPSQQKNLSFTSSLHALQATVRRLGVLITHKQFVRDDIQHGMLVQIGEAVLNPYQAFYFVCRPEKLREESIIALRNWFHRQFSGQG